MAAIAFLGNAWWAMKHPKAPNCIPAGAVAVIEIKNPAHAWQALIKTPGWNLLSNLPLVRSAGDAFMSVKLKIKAETDLLSFSDDKTLYISLHKTTGKGTDALYLMTLAADSDQIIAAKVISSFRQKPGVRFLERNYSGYTINDIHEPGGRTFSYVFHQGIFAGSFAPFLVEDVIRKLNDSPMFGSLEPDALSTIQLPDDLPDGISLKADMSQIPGILQLPGFTDIGGTLQAASFASAFKGGLKTGSEILALKGFTNAGPNSYLGIFSGESPQAFKAAELLPGNAAFIFRTAFNSADGFAAKLIEYRKAIPSDPMNAAVSAESAFAERLKTALQSLGNETVLCLPENFGSPEPDRLLILPCPDPSRLLAELQELAPATASGTVHPDSLYSETGNGFMLRQLALPETPAFLLGNFYKGFPECYALQLPHAIILSNKAQALKKLASDIEDGETFAAGMTAKKDQSDVAGLGTESNVLMIVNTERIWRSLFPVAGSGESMPASFIPLLRRLPLLKFSCASGAESGLFSSELSLNARPGRSETNSGSAELKGLYNASLSRAIISAPQVLRNPKDKSLEVLFQDSAKDLILLNKVGNLVFRSAVRENIISEIRPVDLNGRSNNQLFFSTPRRLCIINRKGDSVAPFPIKLPKDLWPTHAITVDYDNSHNYRFLVADKNNGLYMLDKHGKSLEGWAPLALGTETANTPQVLRIGGKDCFLVPEHNGLLHLFNRRGQEYPGFPFNCGARLSNPLFVSQGLSFTASHIIILTDNGEVITIDFNGKLLNSLQLYRPGKETGFVLCPDPGGKTFAIARRDADSVTIFSRDLRSLFTKRIGRKNSFKIRYYNFGAGNEVVALFIPEAKKTTLYSASGQVLPPGPIESTERISLLYSDAAQAYFLYRVSGRHCIGETFRRVYRQ
ncbi:MAG: hypothetical protein V4543_17750 [Bacteroidota bacterium]